MANPIHDWWIRGTNVSPDPLNPGTFQASGPRALFNDIFSIDDSRRVDSYSEDQRRAAAQAYLTNSGYAGQINLPQGFTKADVDARIQKIKAANEVTHINRTKLSQAPQILQAQNTAAAQRYQADATNKLTKSNREIAEMQLLSGDKNAAAERLQQLTMAENADIRAQQQWLRQMEYMDRKDQALKEEKELETLIAGLTMLGANLFV